MNKLPFFVYGTLMSGLYNHRVISGYAESIVEATLKNAQMYAIPGAFPYVVKSENGEVKGELIYAKEHLYEDALASCDMLEGYIEGHNDCFYNREKVIVTTSEGEEVEAWTYYAGTVAGYKAKIVEDGNYKNFLNNSAQYV